MSLSSLQLDAFFEVAKARSFSAAAKRLHITQSALSQRVLNLEQELGSTLLVREPSGLRLTELGERLLRYCQTRDALETEALSGLSAEHGDALAGIVRVSGFSSVMRSVVLPAISELARKHPLVQLEISSRELRDLPALLKSGEADWVFTSTPIQQAGIVNELLSEEEYVLVTSKSMEAREHVYLDHDASDMITADFFARNPERKPATYTRSFCDDIYGLIDGVKLGLGRAVIPLHLVHQCPEIKVLKGYKNLRVPMYLNYYSQPFFTRLQLATLETFRRQIPKLLK